MKRIKPESTRYGTTTKIELGGTDTYVTLNRLPDKRAIEMFITTDRKGESQGWANLFSIMVSMALQNGVPSNRIIEKMIGQRFDPVGGFGEPVSVADAIGKWWRDQEVEIEGTKDAAVKPNEDHK